MGFGDVQIAGKDYPSIKLIKDSVAKDLVSKGTRGVSAKNITILNINELSADDFNALLDNTNN